jgi:hypothetical protein
MKHTATQALVTIAIALAIVVTVKVIQARAGETPVYDKDGKYSGSVFDYGKTQTYTDRNGHFNGSAVNNNNGSTSFYNRNGSFSGSAGSSIDRAFNFNKR